MYDTAVLTTGSQRHPIDWLPYRNDKKDTMWRQTTRFNSKNSLSGGVKYMGWENFAVFGRNRHLSWKR